MTIRLGDIAPNFSAPTTEGTIDFHEWKKGKWAVLFSHPKDFTPVCTTELGYTAKLRGEFEKRNVKVIGAQRGLGRRPRALEQGHRGDAGPRSTSR